MYVVRGRRSKARKRTTTPRKSYKNQLNGRNQSKILKDQKEAEEYEHEKTESTTKTGWLHPQQMTDYEDWTTFPNTWPPKTTFCSYWLTLPPPPWPTCWPAVTLTILSCPQFCIRPVHYWGTKVMISLTVKSLRKLRNMGYSLLLFSYTFLGGYITHRVSLDLLNQGGAARREPEK